MAQTEQVTEQDAKVTEAQQVELTEATDTSKPGGAGNLDLLLDITMSITVNLGDAQVPIKQLLQLGPGSVLQMDKLIDEPAELYVQGNKFATGDIVVVEGRFAIRIKEVIGI